MAIKVISISSKKDPRRVEYFLDIDLWPILTQSGNQILPFPGQKGRQCFQELKDLSDPYNNGYKRLNSVYTTAEIDRMFKQQVDTGFKNTNSKIDSAIDKIDKTLEKALEKIGEIPSQIKSDKRFLDDLKEEIKKEILEELKEQKK